MATTLPETATSQSQTLIPSPIEIDTDSSIGGNLKSEEIRSTNGGDSVDKLTEKHPGNDDETQGDKRKREGEDEEGETKARHPMWKTSLCSFYRRQDKDCSHGENCRYAHSEEELRPRPDNSWDPTSERAKKIMKLENGDNIVGKDDVREDVFMPDALVDSLDPSLDKCLLNLPKKWISDDLKSFMDELGVVYKTARKKTGMAVGFVGFETADLVKAGIERMDGKAIGNRHVKVANVVPRTFEKKAMLTVPDSDDPDGPLSINGSEDGNAVPRARTVRDAVTPLAHMSYSDQLEHKKNSLAQTLKRLTRHARKACSGGVTLPEWILKSKEIGGLPCKLEGIVESPLVKGYRNKCEFSVGLSVQGKPTVGFMLGNFREGVTAVEEPVDCPNVSQISCKLASIFQGYLQHSALPVWNRIDNTGFWRQLTVREGRNPGSNYDIENFEANISEVMVMVQVCTTGIDKEVLTKEFQSMALAFSEGVSASSPPLPLTSLVVQDHTGISNVAPADAPLKPLSMLKAKSASGEESESSVVEGIHDYIGNQRFCISPTAFFQVNTLAAEKLYSLAGDWAGLGPDTLLFDVCCGTGTIGLTLAHRVGMVVGIEMNASAVLDAKRNAEINNIKNCRFICSKAEDVMGSLLKEYIDVAIEKEEPLRVSETNDSGDASGQKESSLDGKVDLESISNETSEANNESGCPQICQEEVKGRIQTICSSEDQNGRNGSLMRQYKDVVAIVDPPRAGLHPTVIKALRTHPSLRRIVYISCNPESLVANAIELCTPSTDKSEKGNTNNRGWRNRSVAGQARQRAKSMPTSEPYQPIKAMAVDLFPHTPHCETVMLLER
ncbi:zinc finger CCCH domain-containing protein 24-like isoform X2 [Papaver somniferum]|nr:zinc finger CCCH domain-containing protein 24-like isoform X2 [Papaver somniferum]